MKRLIALLMCLPTLLAANDWDALAAPDTIAIMRHALAPGTGDPARFKLEDCTTQRNLDARGQAQARAIGAEIRARGIAFDGVLTSQWCRTRDTARLLDIGPVMDAPSLNSFFEDYATRDTQTRQTLDLLSQNAEKLMLVTHQVNITALTGRGTRSGEMLVLRITDGRVEVVGSIMIDP